MDHVNPATCFILFHKPAQRFIPELPQSGIYPDIAPHLFYKFHLTVLKQNFFMFYAAGAALAAFLEDGLEGGIVEVGSIHDRSGLVGTE